MGMIGYERSGIFYPEDFGLDAGDVIQIVLVGAGASGGVGNISENGLGGGSGFVHIEMYKLTHSDILNGIPVVIGAGGIATLTGDGIGAGGDSTFGDIFTALGAKGQQGLYRGGEGMPGQVHGGGGAGGYIPGLKNCGGDGQKGGNTVLFASGTAGVNGFGSLPSSAFPVSDYSAIASDGLYKGGKKGESQSIYYAASGGSGYGAGGGGGARGTTTGGSYNYKGGDGADGWCGIYV